MRNFFAQPMGFGRFPQKTRQAVFAAWRQYFDQVLYKNMRFRHEYALAYRRWLDALPDDERQPPLRLLRARILAGIDLTGQDAVRELFADLAAHANSRFPATPIPPDCDFADTLPFGAYDTNPAYARPMELIKRFWLRIALPEVFEEDTATTGEPTHD